MEARYYNGNIGKFVSPDPAFWNLDRLTIQTIDPQSWNSYAYARNNPMVYNDPDGQFWDTVVDVAFTAYDSAKFLKSFADGLGGAATVGVGKLAGSDRMISLGDAQLSIGVQGMQNVKTDLAIDAVGSLTPFVPVAGLKATVNAVDRAKGLDSLIQAAKAEVKAIDAQRTKVIQQAMKTGESEVVRIAETIFKRTDTVKGGTGGAVRFEKETGVMLSRTGHETAAASRARWIDNTMSSVNKGGQNMLNSFKKGLERSLNIRF